MAGESGVPLGKRVIVADDDVLMREGLSSLLERSGFQVVGRAGDGSELVSLVRQHRPDLAIVDIRMPPTRSTEGLDAAGAIRKEYPETAILILSAHVEVTHAMKLLASGSHSGYLLKSRVTDIEEFLETLEHMCRGGSVVDPSLVQELVSLTPLGWTATELLMALADWAHEHLGDVEQARHRYMMNASRVVPPAAARGRFEAA